jgi:tetratricopeptide (TPR) repeat protein
VGDRTVNPEAYEAYLKGNFYWDRLNCEGFSKALEYFQQAAAKDPNFARAYSGMADSYFNLADWECVPQDEAFVKSKAAALKALELDPASGEAHTQLGELAFYHEWDWSKAEKELKQGIALDPSQGHGTYAIFLVAMGRQEEGLAEMRKAHEIDPVSEVNNVMSTYVFYLTHHFDEAIDQANKTLELYPRSGATFFWLGTAYEMKGMNEEAINTFLHGDALNGMKEEQIAAYRNAYQKSGMEGYWRLEQNTVRPKKFNGVCWEMLCSRHYPDKERTLQLLSLGFQRHCDGLQFLKVDPIYRSFQGNPKFNDLLARMQF